MSRSGMRLAGITMMRNEVDVVATTIGYHLALGCDLVLVLDNGSTDGTTEVLRRLAGRDPRVVWSRDDGPYRQSEMMTGLAHEARSRGADWVLPFDADEYWWCGSDRFRTVLDSTRAGVLLAPVVNFVQRREQRRSEPGALRHMTMRAEPVGSGEQAMELVTTRQIGFVQIVYPPKAVARTSAEMVVAPGNHYVHGVPGEALRTDALACLHAPLRSWEALARQVEIGRRVAETFPADGGWHARRWRQLGESGELEAEWRANSHDGGALDVYGRRYELVPDRRLRDAVTPFLRPWRRLLGR